MILPQDSEQLYNKFNSQNPSRGDTYNNNKRQSSNSRNNAKKEKSFDQDHDASLYSDSCSP